MNDALLRSTMNTSDEQPGGDDSPSGALVPKWLTGCIGIILLLGAIRVHPDPHGVLACEDTTKPTHVE